MECLKLLQELNVMADALKIPTLQHFYKNFEPATSRALAQTITHFHIKELESADLRSAYGQLSDWLYGWNVENVAELGDELLDHFKAKRQPRNMDLRSERERAEALRIMKIYETLHQITRRLLSKYYNDIEAELPKIGQGIGVYSTSGKEADNEFFDDERDVDKVWAIKSNEELDGNLELDLNDSDEEINESKAKSDIKVRRSLLNGDKTEKEFDTSLNELEEEREDETQDENESGQEQEDDIEVGRSSIASRSQESLSIDPTPTLPVVSGGFQFMSPNGADIEKQQQPLISQSESLAIIQRDINHIFLQVDRSTDYTLVTLSTIMVIMAFAEFMNDKDAYSKYYSLAHELSLNFVSNTLKTVWDLLNKELPGQISHADIRNLNSLRLKIRKTLELRKQDGKIPKFKIRKLHFKFALLNDMFTMMDIFIFPNFVEAHSDGVKGLQYSTFDNYLWLSGGHDCILKIHDIRLSNHHLCLAQYVGHKSIITDVHFNKEESQILSSSFDRTVKLWSSQNSTCERTFIGHTDAVLSCDFSPDGRYVASGSMDNTIKIWDLSTGECVSTAKKHTRWVKVVRYSGDGKHLVSASLDRRILIWDSKLLVNSKTPTPIKTIDVHLDYVLDIAIKENKILTTSRDNSIRMFDLITGYELNSYDLSPSWACTVSFSDNGDYFATGSFDNNLVIFKTSDFSKVRQIRVFNFGIMAIRFPGDLSYVAVGTSEGFIQQIPL